jgi:hypothetical protein
VNIRLIALRVWLPAWIRDRGLQELTCVAEDAFRAPAHDTMSLSYRDRLRAFAEDTRDQARAAAGSPDVDSVKRRLFENARCLGEELGERLRIKTDAEALDAARILYRAIGIDFRGRASGDVVIRKCYFSKFYSAHACRVMSSIDEGLIAGLSGGGRLSFTSRITEGQPCCRAVIEFERRSQ